MAKPKWASPSRQAYLVKLFSDSGGFCVFGHKPCTIPDHHYEVFIEGLISDWVGDDRVQRQADWNAERRQLHILSERSYPLQGQFNAVDRDIYFENQPQYYLDGLAISGLTFRPFAKVRMASSYMRLHVDLGESLKSVSKNKRRKAIRYGKALPVDTQRKVDKICNLAVKHYLDH